MKPIVAILLAAALLPGASAPAQEADAGAPVPLAVSAFADLQLPEGAGEAAGDRFAVNQAEVDLEGTIRPRTTAAMALAYDPETRGFTLAVLAAEYALAADGPCTAALKVGQFDVPFGVDWRVYASLDRRLVTPPLMVAGTHEGWNDLGANLRLEAGPARADLFLLNGSSCGRGVQTCKVEREDIARAWGGRVGATWGPLEFGASGAVFHDVDDRIAMTMGGGDLQAWWGPLTLRGEYVVQQVDHGTTVEARTRGWYAQGIWDFGGLYAFTRYDGLDPEAPGAARPVRWSLGGGRVIDPGLELRLEHQVGERDLPNTTWLQLVMSFGALGG